MRGRLDVQGLRDAQLRLDEIGDRAKAPEPALRSHATLEAVRGSARRTFARGRFKKNTPDWEARKRKRGLSPKRMQARGILRYVLEQGSPGTSVRFTANRGELVWGLYGGRAAGFYARILADRDRQRRVVKIDRGARIDIGDIVALYVAQGVTR